MVEFALSDFNVIVFWLEMQLDLADELVFVDNSSLVVELFAVAVVFELLAELEFAAMASISGCGVFLIKSCASLTALRTSFWHVVTL